MKTNTLEISGKAVQEAMSWLETFEVNLNARQPFVAILDESSFSDENFHIQNDATLVLNLGSLKLVEFSNRHFGKLRWFSQVDPRELLGPLLDHFRGTYYRSYRHELVYSSDSDVEVYPLKESVRCTPELLAAVCIARESSVSTGLIKAVLCEGGITELKLKTNSKPFSTLKEIVS